MSITYFATPFLGFFSGIIVQNEVIKVEVKRRSTYVDRNLHSSLTVWRTLGNNILIVVKEPACGATREGETPKHTKLRMEVTREGR